MKFIGITGGVGAGKSAILSYLAGKPKTKVMLADEIAHELMEPGTQCYEKIVERFHGEDIFHGEGMLQEESVFLEKAAHGTSENMKESRPFDRVKLAQVIFSDARKREQMNAIVHPAVKEYVRKQYHTQLQSGELDLLVLEAALLIEEKYDELCDELWYIYTSEDIRRKRLVESRGYSQEKIDSIFKSQLSEEEFRKHTQVTIDNNGDLEETFRQIEQALRREANE